ncbi:MAG: S26 family signal peptidase [Acetatifactor sp.]
MEEKKNPEALLLAGTTIQIVPSGYSMYPLVNPNHGDAVILEPLGDRRPQKGEVVLFRRCSALNPGEGDLLVLHRIVRITSEGYYLVGDNQSQMEGPIERSRMCGVMTAVIKGGRRISVTDLRYRLFCGLWRCFLPIRPALLRFAARCRKRISRK